jgi:hypothetical protein
VVWAAWEVINLTEDGDLMSVRKSLPLLVRVLIIHLAYKRHYRILINMNLENSPPNQIEKTLLIGVVLAIIYVIFRVVAADVIFVAVLAMCILLFVLRLKWLRLREKGTL